MSNNEHPDTKQEFFEDALYDDLESGYSKSFFFCDACIDDLINNWKGIYINDISLQMSYVEVDMFYDQSKYITSWNITYEEFKKYIERVTCPNCGKNLRVEGVIYPYDVPIDRKKFNKDIKQLASLSKKVPFMILTHEFAQKVNDIIKEVSKKTGKTEIEDFVFRCRRIRDQNKPFTKQQSGVPPDAIVREGRFNHAGYGVLYLGTTEDLCFIQIEPDKKNSVSMAKIKIQKKLKLLNLTEIEAYDNDIFKAMMASALLVNPAGGEGWDQPGYVFTRFIADCALYHGFDGIMYNSAKSHSGKNIVILRDKTIEAFTWNSIYEIIEVYLYRYKGFKIPS